MPIDDLPRLGLGTFSEENRDQWADAVEHALEAGYRHVDTAQVYGNEEYVGQGLAHADVDREDVFLATKTVHHDVPPDPADVPDAIDDRLDELGVDYVDMLYVHWPSGIYDHEEILPAFDRAYEEDKTRHVGLSNFTPELVEEAKDVLDAPVAAIQVECHPLLQQDELVAYAQEHDHWLVSYSPLGKGEVFDVPVIEEIAEKHDATPAQVSLAWLLSRDNVAAIPKSMTEAHQIANLAARDLELDEEDRERIAAIDREHRVIDPDWGPWNW